MNLLARALQGIGDTAPLITAELQMHLHGALDRSKRAELSRRIRGKYANLIPSSEDFVTLKAEELALEERRSRA